MSQLTNLILATDSYKFSHFKQYPANTTDVHSYIEARGTKIAGVERVVHFGLQAFIKQWLMKPITRQDVEDAATFCKEHGVPFNYEGWMHIVVNHQGYMPVRIKSVAEGTPVPLSNATVTIHATDPECFWLVSYLETIMLQYVWYGSTVATLSREIKKSIMRALQISADNPEAEIGFKLHDFGYRGVSSQESAGAGGAAHLVNFLGTDTVRGILYAKEYYGANTCGFSISASEHSTMTSWGREGEFEAYKNMVDQYAKPGALFACVIDSYNWINAIDLWAKPQPGLEMSLLDMVKAQGATVVLRPDSGDPIATPIQVIEMLMDRVGFDVNTKGFRVLPGHVRVIQGDGIDHQDVNQILDVLLAKGISASNIAFGMGGGLLQKVNRDTFKFAMKCSAAQIDGTWKDVYKEPMGQPDKKSKKGVLSTFEDKDGNWTTVPVTGPYIKWEDYPSCRLHVVYEAHGGRIHTHFINFDQVRLNAAI